ncbi:MAG: serine hydroxymethyltransferase [Acidobacteriota bacterium]
MKNLSQVDAELASALWNELQRQREGLELIASENYPPLEVIRVAGNMAVAKYAEGTPFARQKGEIDWSQSGRYYGGCGPVNEIERIAFERACKLFKVGWVNVQPWSGSQANQAVYLALMKPGETFLGMDLKAGGHLTHGAKVSSSGIIWNSIQYGVTIDGHPDYVQMEELARSAGSKPKLVMCGGSAVVKNINFRRVREIADRHGIPYVVADIAHPAGLIAAELPQFGGDFNPFEWCDVVTTTTHKTLRGTRGGMIMVKDEGTLNKHGAKASIGGRIRKISELLDSAVMPGIQGGPGIHLIAAKALGFKYNLEPGFKVYAAKIVENARALAQALIEDGWKLVGDGTENHCILINFGSEGINGKQAEEALEQVGITVNKNAVPGDTRSPTVTSGIRLGTPALTTRGMGSKEMKIIASWISQVLKNPENESLVADIRNQVRDMAGQFPLYPELS